ncbi:MAG: class B sortase [Ruminococcus sp.]|nr:class B sortase [Ruminococcus sp.]
MNPVKVISVISAFVAVTSISVAVLMLNGNKAEEVPVIIMEEETVENPVETEFTDGEVVVTTDISERNYDFKVTTETTIATSLPVYPYVPANSGMNDYSKYMRKYNKDFVGWLKINNTQVNYPLMKDPGEVQPNTGYGSAYCPADEFYLHHDFDRNYLFEGTLYMDYRDVLGNDETKQSENIVIYGHNMLNDSMFGSLDHYYQIDGFYNSNQFIELSTNYKEYGYVIFGYIITSGNAGVPFDYWNWEELDCKEDFDWYVSNIRISDMIETDIDVQYGDKLLTLSTCYQDADNSRFIIVARRLREGEKLYDMSTIQRIPPPEPVTEETNPEENQEIVYEEYYEE